MNMLFSFLPFLQNTAPASAANTLFGRFSEVEFFALSMMALVFLVGCYALLDLSFKLMALQRDRLLAKYHPEVLAARMVVSEVAVVEAGPSWWELLKERLDDTVPIDQEEAIVLDHSYDGVRELDNNLPPWWKGLFYATIAFAPVYLYFNQFSSFSQTGLEEYEVNMSLAEAKVAAYMKTQDNVLDESNIPLLADNDALGKGQMLYTAKCSPCHGKAGEGGIGPNLTDPYWLHGGSISDVYITIKNGVPDKGMIPWKNELRPRDMQEIASYIMAMQGTDPANGKEPQGDLYEAEAEIETQPETEASK